MPSIVSVHRSIRGLAIIPVVAWLLATSLLFRCHHTIDQEVNHVLPHSG